MVQGVSLDDQVRREYYFSNDDGINFARLPAVDKWIAGKSAEQRGRCLRGREVALCCVHVMAVPADRTAAGSLVILRISIAGRTTLSVRAGQRGGDPHPCLTAARR